MAYRMVTFDKYSWWDFGWLWLLLVRIVLFSFWESTLSSFADIDANVRLIIVIIIRIIDFMAFDMLFIITNLRYFMLLGTLNGYK